MKCKVIFNPGEHLVVVKTGTPLQTIAAYYRVGSLQKSKANPKRIYLNDSNDGKLTGSIFGVDEIETLE